MIQILIFQFQKKNCRRNADFINNIPHLDIIFIIKWTLLQIQIMNILWETAHYPKASYDFSKAHGILTWILQLTERR